MNGNANRVVLQVPMSKKLRQEAEKASDDLGFSSLQETVRLLLQKLADKQLTLSFHEPDEYVTLSPAAKKRYARILKDIKAGRNIVKADTAEEFLSLLRA